MFLDGIINCIWNASTNVEPGWSSIIRTCVLTKNWTLYQNCLENSTEVGYLASGINPLWISPVGYVLPGFQIGGAVYGSNISPTSLGSNEGAGWSGVSGDFVAVGNDVSVGSGTLPGDGVVKREEQESNVILGNSTSREVKSDVHEKSRRIEERGKEGSVGESRVRKTKGKTMDREYLPHRSEKKELRKRLHENENRNVVPNEINQIISFLQKRSKSEGVLSRLWERFPGGEGYSVSRFYLYQGILKERTGHYSNEQQLKLLGQLYEP